MSRAVTTPTCIRCFGTVLLYVPLLCVGVLVWFVGVLVYWCIGVLVYWCFGTLHGHSVCATCETGSVLVVRVCMDAYVVWTRVYVHVYAWKRMYGRVCMYVHVYAWTRMHGRVRVPMYMDMYVCARCRIPVYPCMWTCMRGPIVVYW